jgi:hypothetical protein
MAEFGAADRSRGDVDSRAQKRLSDDVAERAGAAMSAGLDPASDQARAVVDGLAGQYASAFARHDDTEFRRWLLARLEVSSDPRAERYWQLLAVINGWPQAPSMAPAYGWFTRALAASLG